ncbi:MAG: sensor histidine kinase [Ramlibacter sp.]|jgi:signal transduction histidine kinase|nr:sensor histidine kinase [Ramlibacter sp.]
MLPPSYLQDVQAVSGIEAVPRILEVVCRATGMGFAAVARVTESRWVCCSVRDEIGFGLKPGGELQVETTLCDSIRGQGEPIFIDHVGEDGSYCGHPTPAMYGFQSYASVPIRRSDGSFWGTLCAIDPRPAVLKTPAVTGMFELFAQLIAFHLDAQDKVRASETALLDARETAQLREQFIAVLGHDLRTPLQTLQMGTMVVSRSPEKSATMLPLMQRSVNRMAELVDNLMDFARGRLGAGLAISPREQGDLGDQLRHVVAELTATTPFAVNYDADLQAPVVCDAARIGQLLSNLLSNALKYGDPQQPVRVVVRSDAAGFVLSVANGGAVIPKDVQDRLFEPYFRGATPKHQEGLGLGLYIVTEIARAHGGSMDVKSDDRETVFTFRLPQGAVAAA